MIVNTEPIQQLLTRKIDDGEFPSAVFAVSQEGRVQASGAFGNAVVNPEIKEARVDTIYDIASLTKPLVTGLLAAKLLESGELKLESRVESYFSETFGSKEPITIRELLTHTSGYPAWKPFYLFENDEDPRKNVFSQITGAQFEYETGKKVLYSDFNFILLGMVIEEISGQSIDKLFEVLVSGPLNLKSTFFRPTSELRPAIAASETGNLYERLMCQEMFPELPISEGALRDRLIWGEVHDGNCYYLGGVAGHAGLFSNCKEISMLASQFVVETSSLLAPETCQLFRQNFTPGLNQHRTLAFQQASTKGCSAGESIPGESFGHLGFTGTSIWIDAENRRNFVLLTNRTHDKKPPFADLAATRKAFNTAGFEMLENAQK